MKDGDLTGNEDLLALDYGFRIYNPAVGRFLSVDPLTQSYPWYTPYQFAGNTPIFALDLDGLEDLPWYLSENKHGGKPILTLGIGKLPIIERTEYSSNPLTWLDNFANNSLKLVWNGFAENWNTTSEGGSSPNIHETIARTGDFFHDATTDDYVSLATDIKTYEAAATIGGSIWLSKKLNLPAPQKLHGNGRLSGVVELGEHVKSNKSFKNLSEQTTFDFVYDAITEKFAVFQTATVSGGHDYLKSSLKSKSEDIVGGRISRKGDRFKSIEWSGHYGDQWTDGIREKFKKFIKEQTGIDIEHSAGNPTSPTIEF